MARNGVKFTNSRYDWGNLTYSEITALTGMVAGDLVFNTTNNRQYIYANSSWRENSGTSSGGSSSISGIESRTESSKLFRTEIPSSDTDSISEPLISGNNWTGTIAAIAQGATSITITPTILGQEPPKNKALTLVQTSTGESEDVFITSGNLSGASGVYTLSSGIVLAGGYAISSPIYRNFCYLNTASANASVLAGQNGIAAKVQSHTGKQVDVGSRSNADVSWSIRLNSLTQGIVVSTISGNVMQLVMSTDRSGEFSATAPYNKLIFCKVTLDGENGVTQVGKGKEFTIASVGAYSTTLPITVNDTYNDMDSGNISATGGLVAAGISNYPTDGNTYWIVQAKTAIPKVSFVATGQNESFVEVTPKKARVFSGLINYFDNFSADRGYTNVNLTGGNGWRVTSGYSEFYNVTTNGDFYQMFSYKDTSFNYYNGFTLKVAVYNVNLSQTAQLSKHGIFWGDTPVGGVVTDPTKGLSLAISGQSNTSYTLFLRTGTTIRASLSLSTTVYPMDTWCWLELKKTPIGYEGRFWKQSDIRPISATVSWAGIYSPVTASRFGVCGTAGSNGTNAVANNRFDDLSITTGYSGMSLSGTESNKTGQLATLRTDIVQSSATATIPTVEAKNLVVSGGL